MKSNELIKRNTPGMIYSIHGFWKNERLLNIFLPLIVAVLIIGLWETVIIISGIPNYVIPAPSAIVKEIIRNLPKILEALKYTLSEILIGYIIGSSIGILMALAFFYSKTVEKIFVPIVSMVNSVPMMAFAALAVLWFGTGKGSKIFLVAIASFFTILVNTLQGLRTSDPLGVDLMKAFGAKEREIFLKYRWPIALHHVFVGLRNASTIAVICTVITEMLGSPGGIGLLLNISQQTSDFLFMWATVIPVSICGVIFYLLILTIEKKVVWWKSGDL